MERFILVWFDWNSRHYLWGRVTLNGRTNPTEICHPILTNWFVALLSSSADFIFFEAWGMEKKMIRAIPCGWQGLTGNIVPFSLIWLLLHVQCNLCRPGWRNRKHQVNPCPESECIHSFDARWSNTDLDQCSWNAPLVIIVQDELFLVYSRMKGNSQSFQALNAFLQSTHVE